MNLRLRLLSKAIVLVAILFSTNYSFSQQAAGGAEIDSTAKVPEAILVVDVIQSIEDVSKKIKLSEKKNKPKQSTLAIDSLYVPYALFIQEQKIEARAFVKANPNRQKVDNLIIKWGGFHEHLKNWESEVNSHEEKNVLLLETIAFDEKTWDLTYQNAKDKKVPIEVLTLVKKTWDDLKKIKKSIIDENNSYLKLESKINKEKIIVNDVIDDLIALKNSNVYDLFYLRHPPLWKASFADSDKKGSKNEEEQNLSKNIIGSYSFLKNNVNSLYLYIILLALIILLFVFLRKIYLKYPFNEENAELQRAKDVIVDHFLSSIIFLSLFIAIIFFTNPPTLITDILFLAILIAAIPLVQPFMFKRFKKLIYFVVLFFILDSAKTYIWFTSGQYRLYILVEALFVIAIIFTFTYPYLKTRKMKIGKFGMLLVRLTPVLYALSLISIISNILGYTNLTDLTLKIVTRSGEITLIFYGILMIAGGITTGLFHSHFSRKKSYDEAAKLKIELKMLQIIRFVAFSAWFIIFLRMIDVYRPLTEWFTEMLTEPYKMGNMTFTIGAIVTFISILVGSYLITSFISFILDDQSLKVLKLPKGVPAAISMVIRYFIIAFSFVLALSALGMDFSKFNLMAGALGIGIGFGLQTVISNFVSGLILVFERPILVGDTVEVNNLLGTVNNIGVRASNIRTFDGAEVVVPNNNLISNDLINWTLSDNVKRVEIIIGTTYGSDPNQILKILTEVAADCEYTLKDPPPAALFSEFGDSSLNFKLRFWVHYEVGLQAKSDVSVGIYNRFKEEGVEIPFPQQDVYIKSLPKIEADSNILAKPNQAANKPMIKKEKPIKEPLKDDQPKDYTADEDDQI